MLDIRANDRCIASGRQCQIVPVFNSLKEVRHHRYLTLDQLSPREFPKRASLSSSERYLPSAEMACKLTGVRRNSSFCVAICKQLRKSSRFRRNEGARSGRNGSPMIYGPQSNQTLLIVILPRGVHRLRHNVRGFDTNRARKQFRRLKYRQPNLAVAIGAKHLSRRLLDAVPQRRLRRQDVAHTFNGLEFHDFGGRALPGEIPWAANGS